MIRRFSGLTSASALVALSVLAATPAHATIRTFNMIWSGDSFGNTALATGTIVIDDSLLPNPGNDTSPLVPSSIGVQSLNLTVTGASTGNGTFTLTDFDGGLDWNTNEATLNLSSELVGQPTAGAPWGTPIFGGGGDFNLFSTDPNVPNGTFWFTLGTSNGNGDQMQLVSFAPAGVTAPEPGSLALLSLAVLPVIGIVRRRSIR